MIAQINKMLNRFGFRTELQRKPVDPLALWPAEKGTQSEKTSSASSDESVPAPEFVINDGTDSKKQQELDMQEKVIFLTQADYIKTYHLYEGTLITGATGSGKTSGPGRCYAQMLCQLGWGGLVLCVKPDDIITWKRFAKQSGREDDLIVFEVGSEFNILLYELKYQLEVVKTLQITDLVEIVMKLVELQNRKGSSGGGDQFFIQNSRVMMGNSMLLQILAKGEVTLLGIKTIINTAAREEKNLQSKEWQKSSFCCQCLELAKAAAMKKQAAYEVAKATASTPEEISEVEKEATKIKIQTRQLKLLGEYFTKELPQMGDKTRTSIEATLNGTLYDLLQDPIVDMFSEGITVSPDDIMHKGKIVVVGVPEKTYGKLGVYANVLWKFAVQRAVERNKERQYPTFIWSDEFQTFCTEYDYKFATTARDSRTCVVYLTQNISNLYAEFTAPGGHDMVESLLGNLKTRIFCKNSQEKTNLWAADSIGKDLVLRSSENSSFGGSTSLLRPLESLNANINSSQGTSEQIDHDREFMPIRFTELLQGGAENNFVVSAIIHQSGNLFSNGKKARTVYFPQKDLVGPKGGIFMACARDSRLHRKYIELGY